LGLGLVGCENVRQPRRPILVVVRGSFCSEIEVCRL
jgi:hypothetical protein